MFNLLIESKLSVPSNKKDENVNDVFVIFFYSFTYSHLYKYKNNIYNSFFKHLNILII